MSKLVTTAFFLADTRGLPLGVCMAHARERGVSVSVPHYYRDALAAGWKSERALSRIEEALVDTGVGRDYIDRVLVWLAETGGNLLPEESTS